MTAGTLEDPAATLYDRVVDSRFRLAFYIAFLIAVPVFFGYRTGSEFLIYGLFAYSFNLLFGRSGLLSFGHALFLGLGAYTTALVVLNTSLPLVAIFALVVLVAVVVSLSIGLISLQLAGVYFAMITLAFAQLFFELAFTMRSISGGETGLPGVLRPSLFGLGLFTPGDSLTFYIFTAVITFICLGFGFLLSRSPFGRTLKGIKENEERTRALGVNTYRVKVVIFVISGTIATIAGALWALYFRFVSPNVFFWENSGDAVIYSLIGGIESLFGPFLGAIGLRWLENNFFATSPGLWNIVLGLVFLTFVLFIQGGIVSLITAFFHRVSGRL